MGIMKRPFESTDLEKVQKFDCGDAEYEREVELWIKGSGAGVDCAVNSMDRAERPSRVWLYELSDALVGYGALAQSEWRWLGKKDPFIPVTLIVWVGLDKSYQGKPPGPIEEKYAVQIMDDLIEEAKKDAVTHPVLGLFVHKDNAKAIRLYRWYNFDDTGLTWKGGDDYIRRV